MMKKLEIPHDAFVFVGDGRKALFLRNVGDEVFPNFRALGNSSASWCVLGLPILICRNLATFCSSMRFGRKE